MTLRQIQGLPGPGGSGGLRDRFFELPGAFRSAEKFEAFGPRSFDRERGGGVEAELALRRFSRLRRLFADGLAPPPLVPGRHVLDAGGASDGFEEFFGDVAGVLLALVAVEGLDVVPAAPLLARGDRGGAGGEGVGTDDQQ